MLKTKLFRGFAALTLVIGVLSALIGMRIIKNRVVDEAQLRVQLDLNSAWAVYDGNLNDTTDVGFNADNTAPEVTIAAPAEGAWTTGEIEVNVSVLDAMGNGDSATYAYRIDGGGGDSPGWTTTSAAAGAGRRAADPDSACRARGRAAADGAGHAP